jgi:predicted NAD-dependent protein-ADP-ribosyltransferase YbiA (DUF1768 family)
MEEVLYLKFKQHPDLQNMLMDTGRAPIVYVSAGDSYWGETESGEGRNQFGKTPVCVRERLRAEEYLRTQVISNSSPTVPPFEIDSQSPFMNHSPHHILYQNKSYPTAMHLYVALDFITVDPDFAERICTYEDVYVLLEAD